MAEAGFLHRSGEHLALDAGSVSGGHGEPALGHFRQFCDRGYYGRGRK